MKVYHKLVFADSVEGTTSVYTNPEWNDLLAMTEIIVIQVYATQASGGTTPTLTVRSHVSGDARTWNQLQANPEINLQTLDTAGQTSLTGFSAATDAVSGFRRLEITLGGTSPKAYLRIFVTGRQVVPATVPDYGTAQRINTTQSGIGANVNLDLNQAGLVRGISYASPLWTLNPGKTYLLRGVGRFENFSDTTGGKLEIRWVDDNNNAVGNVDPKAVCMPVSNTNAQSQNPVVEVIYTVPPDATPQQRGVKLRCVSANGTADIVPGAGWTSTVVEIPGA